MVLLCRHCEAGRIDHPKDDRSGQLVNKSKLVKAICQGIFNFSEWYSANEALTAGECQARPR